MSKNVLLITVVIWALLPNLSAQVAPQTAAVGSSSTSAPILEDGTPVKLRIGRTVSSADARVGETVDFEVLEEVKIGNLLIIPKGGTAIATVTEAQSKRRMARGGKLDINIDYVRLADGEKPALRAVKDVKGGGHTGAMTGAIVATSIVFFPAAPLFLFMHGKDITIPKGTEVTAYVNGNFPIDLAKFQPGLSTSTSNIGPGSPTSNTQAELEISSTPAGADISVDGSFVGQTPSTISVSSGEHTISVQLTGYQTWERKMRTSSGKVKLAAVLATAKSDVQAPVSASQQKQPSASPQQ